MQTLKNILIIIVLLVVAFVLYTFGKTNEATVQDSTTATTTDQTVVNDETNWVTYRNETYGFEIQHPADWQVATSTGVTFEPHINIYKEGETQQPPFIHHDDVTNVSIFPGGIPTEGVFGVTATTTVKFGPEIAQAHDFLLQDGTRWATYATFENVPESWENWGFVWARVSTENVTEKCFVGTTEVPMSNCPLLDNPLATVVREGSVDINDRAIEVRIMESLRFIQ